MGKYLLTVFTLICFFGPGCKKNNTILTDVKQLPHYPSASGIEYFNNKIYIIGDDANNMLVLDSNLSVIDSIPLYSFPEKRIPKSVKPDLESMTLLPENKILLSGSGSWAPQRNVAWLIDPATKEKDSIRLDTFYQRLSLYGIKELNIEGIASVPGGFILCNRGNKGYQKNQLVFVKNNFWQQQSQTEIRTAFFGSNTDSNVFHGVSGLGYSAKNDMLISTVSTEDTRNSIDDGAIGKSYLWIVKNISAKKRWKAINPDKIIDLEKTDTRFKGQKIESVCITKETKKLLYLLLPADNDNGSSTLFKLVVSKE